MLIFGFLSIISQQIDLYHYLLTRIVDLSDGKSPFFAFLIKIKKFHFLITVRKMIKIQKKKLLIILNKTNPYMKKIHLEEDQK